MNDTNNPDNFSSSADGGANSGDANSGDANSGVANSGGANSGDGTPAMPEHETAAPDVPVPDVAEPDVTPENLAVPRTSVRASAPPASAQAARDAEPGQRVVPEVVPLDGDYDEAYNSSSSNFHESGGAQVSGSQVSGSQVSGSAVLPRPALNGPAGPTKGTPKATPPPDLARDRELDLFDHLAELRLRLLHCIGAVGVLMMLTWFFRDALLEWFAAPIARVLKEHKGAELITFSPTEGFVIYMQTTFAAALLLAMPYVLWQIWAFVEPALTHHERRYTSVLVPFSILLFVMGALLGYFMTPVFFRFFLSFQPPGSVANYSYGIAVTLLAKMLLVFGACFQVPVVTVFLNKTGIVSRNLMIEYWRHVVVVIFTVVAIITPTWDPISLLAAAVPPCLLYGLSIWLVKWL